MEVNEVREKSRTLEELNYMKAQALTNLIDNITRTKPSALFYESGGRGVSPTLIPGMNESEVKQQWQEWVSKVKTLVYEKAYEIEGLTLDELKATFNKGISEIRKPKGD